MNQSLVVSIRGRDACKNDFMNHDSKYCSRGPQNKHVLNFYQSKSTVYSVPRRRVQSHGKRIIHTMAIGVDL